MKLLLQSQQRCIFLLNRYTPLVGLRNKKSLALSGTNLPHLSHL